MSRFAPKSTSVILFKLLLQNCAKPKDAKYYLKVQASGSQIRSHIEVARGAVASAMELGVCIMESDCV